MLFHITTVTHPVRDIPQPLVAVVLERDSQFVGKMPEGTQRLALGAGVRFSKLRNVFLTGVLDWSLLGGLPGSILYLGSIDKAGINVWYGLRVVAYIVALWRRFVYRFGIEVGARVLADGEVHRGDYFAMRLVALVPPSAPVPEMDAGVFAKLSAVVAHMFPRNGNSVLQNQLDPLGKAVYEQVVLPPVSNTTASTLYVLEFDKAPGKFLVDAAKALGVPMGPLFGRLKNGGEVEVDGVVITSNQVVGPPRAFPLVCVIDIPSPAYLQPAMASPKWFEPIDSSRTTKPQLVYHFFGLLVDLDAPEFAPYWRFMESFGPECQHIVSHADYCPDTTNARRLATFTLKLKAVMPDFFNLPLQAPARRLLAEVAPQGLQSRLRPLCLLQRANITTAGVVIDETNANLAPIDWSALYDEHVENLVAGDRRHVTSAEARVLVFRPQQPQPNLKDQVTVLTIGTGSSMPSMYRNVLGTYVRVPHLVDPATNTVRFHGVFFDAGESTLGNLKRQHTPEEITVLFTELRLIYLSHLHADHHLGIVLLVREWARVQQELPVEQRHQHLYIVAPWSYRQFVAEWMRLEPGVELEQVRFISLTNFFRGSRTMMELADMPLDAVVELQPGTSRQIPAALHPGFVAELYADLGLDNITTGLALHCQYLYTVAVQWKTPIGLDFKCLYLGDTRPLKLFVQVGSNSDLLIHEATLDDERVKDALMKQHLTFLEALYVAQLMRARKVVLTHFSQRYPESPKVRLGARQYVSVGNHWAVDPSNPAVVPDWIADDDVFKALEHARPRWKRSNLCVFNTLPATYSHWDGLPHVPVPFEVLYAYDGMIIEYGRIHEQQLLVEELARLLDELAAEEEEEEEPVPKKLKKLPPPE